MKNIPLLVGTLLATFGLIIGVAFAVSRPKIVDRNLAERDARNVKGAQNARVTIAEFSDFQCPGCQGALNEIKSVMDQYPNDVRFIYRHYPLNFHQNARKAAEAAEAAATFGKFWPMHDLLFQEQSVWEGMSEQDFQAKVLEYAEKLQIDKTQFQQRIESQEVRDKVTADLADGVSVGVPGTPTFYVNGQEASAPQLRSTVESYLESTK